MAEFTKQSCGANGVRSGMARLGLGLAMIVATLSTTNLFGDDFANNTNGFCKTPTYRNTQYNTTYETDDRYRPTSYESSSPYRTIYPPQAGTTFISNSSATPNYDSLNQRLRELLGSDDSPRYDDYRSDYRDYQTRRVPTDRFDLTHDEMNRRDFGSSISDNFDRHLRLDDRRYEDDRRYDNDRRYEDTYSRDRSEQGPRLDRRTPNRREQTPRYDDRAPVRRDRGEERRPPQRDRDNGRYDDYLSRTEPGRFEDRLPQDWSPIPPRNEGPTYQPTAPVVRPEDQLSESEKIQLKLTARYGDPVVQRFVQAVSPQQAMNLFQEASNLIDSRHREPVSYQVRLQRGASNLMEGLRNQTFTSANRLQPSSNQIQSFQASMNQYINGRAVNDRNSASQVVWQIASMAQQQVGIPTTTTILEFVYGSTESLDKYSTFLPEDPRSASLPDEFQNRKTAATGLEDNIVGIGIEVKPHADGIEIVRPLRGGPAQQAGVQKGDIVVAINGRRLAGQNMNYAVDMIGGPLGSSLSMTIVRNGQQLSPITVTRQNVRVYSVSEVEMKENKTGYIKLDKFAQSSSQEVDEALWQLHRQGMQSLIFDLRGNPGGLLTTAIEISNKFLPSGVIVSTHGRTQQDEMQESATYAQTWKVPLVVLVDGDSASASEIFAAAIQDNKRGLVVGQQSYGKGTVQTHFPLQSVAGNLKLTTAKFYAPSGREMAGAGVTPDITVQKSSYRDGNMASNYDRELEAAMQVASGRDVQELASAKDRQQQTLPVNYQQRR
ncbi:S41 family peptidase [Thalassoroseus pseudoceratinae]|uniref:S41 family peptidase n=1 Tax=Thalassoroseus pseudoceratinae TaxID=2713176 RepID=UPI001423F849|nr:S41 family peptidase [Thalassoroseus pseudoceratinae]